jgi:PPM family protein phosphatase
MLTAAGLSDIGCKRRTNEDRILVDVSAGLFVVADGMGGQRCGGRAAEIAASTLRECFHSAVTPFSSGVSAYDAATILRDRMAAALQLANERVFGESSITPECEGMGCTLSAITVAGNLAVIGHVGDSRIYLYRNKELVQLTRDDSVVAQLISAGEITADDVSSHPMRNMLTQSVGAAEEVAIQILDFWLQPGDRLLMTSDGVHGVIGEARIVEALSGENSPSDVATRLVAASRESGAPDNTSTIVVDYEET